MGRDGAFVMKKLAEILGPRLNPFRISVWCANQCCQLLLKDIFKDVQEFRGLVEKLDEVFQISIALENLKVC